MASASTIVAARGAIHRRVLPVPVWDMGCRVIVGSPFAIARFDQTDMTAVTSVRQENQNTQHEIC
jgi:hypothetical protein